MATKNKSEVQQLRESDQRIADALAVLQSHCRGLNVLAKFKFMALDARGLDSQGQYALITLTQELAGGRRTFLDAIKSVSDNPDPFSLCDYLRLNLQALRRLEETAHGDASEIVSAREHVEMAIERFEKTLN